MTQALKAVFKPEAIAACGWKGAKEKVALKDCSKICLLLETVGSTTKITVTHLGVNNFLVSNFRYGEYNIKRKTEREALANAEANNDWDRSDYATHQISSRNFYKPLSWLTAQESLIT